MNDNIIPFHDRVLLDDASKKFTIWVETASPGEKYCYYTGDAIRGNCQVARIAFRAFEKGSVTLYQKRNGAVFDYYAVKKKWR